MATQGLKRKEIILTEGINTLVSPTLTKIGELSYAENARCEIIGTIEKRSGTSRLGNNITATANHGIFYFENSNPLSSHFFRISTVGGNRYIYYLNTSDVWTALSDTPVSSPSPSISPSISPSVSPSISFSVSPSYSPSASASSSPSASPSSAPVFTGLKYSTAIAEGCCFFVNGENANRYIKADGTTVVSSGSAYAGNHLFNSPTASVVNYYKDRLYVADYTKGLAMYKNSIMRSSMPLGIVALVDGDHATAQTTIKVTDTKYIYATDSLDVYRGNTKILTLTVSAKTESEITVSSTGAALESADEVWVAGTFQGDRIFRWSGNPSNGIDVKEYDTFKITGSQNDAITMMANIGNVMMIANKTNLAVWDNSSLINLDLGIGCTSKRGFVRTSTGLYFLAYDGVYRSIGEVPELLSSKVEAYIKGATKEGLENASAGKKGLSVFFHIGTVTLYNPDGSTKKTIYDVVLEYNVRTTGWFVHTGIKAEQFATYVEDTNTDRLIFASAETGYQIMEFLYNNATDDKVASTSEIPFRIDSEDIYLSKSFEDYFYPMQLMVEIDRGSNMTCWISVDDSEFYELQGDLIKGVNVIKVQSKDKTVAIPPRCRKMKVSFRDNSKQICVINRFAIVYSLSAEEDAGTRRTV